MSHNLYSGWEFMIEGEDELLNRLDDTKSTITLPSGKTVDLYRGRYGNIPVMLVQDGDLGDRMFMKAYGINRTNTRANATNLRKLVKASGSEVKIEEPKIIN